MPKEHGGAGLSIVDVCAVKEAVASSGSALSMHVLGELSGPPRVGSFMNIATPAQYDRYLHPVCAARKAVCFALTESEAGSDAAAIQTRAVRDGDHFVLNGRKRFISGAPYADFAIVLAVTDAAARSAGISAFFVDLDGTQARVESDYMAMSGQHSHGDIVLENCVVPAANLIGEEGTGFRLGMARINLNRLLHCPTMLGLAKLSLDLAIQHANKRRQFGQAIAEFQAIQHMIADMATELYAARAMMYDAAAQFDRGESIRTEACMCKLLSSEMAFRIADRSIQVHGGVGLMRGHPVEWIFRMLRMYRIVTGTSEIQRNTIAKSLLDVGGKRG